MKANFLIIIITIFITISCKPRKESMSDLIKNRLDLSVQHYLLMAESLIDRPDRLPRTFIDGELVTSNSRWWCSGFVPGSLWYLYEHSGSLALLDYARNYTARVEEQKHTTSTHDLGFMLYCSFGNGIRITGDTAYKSVLLTGAESLISRFNPTVGCIRSWDHNSHRWQFPVIIDNMMNLEFLFWASKVTGDPKYYDICVSHADVSMKHFFRSDYSAYHVVSFIPETGEVEVKNTHQGYSDDSAWSRGQAWAFYGYTVMYRETKDPKYLDLAKKSVDFMINHPNMPSDKIPYWDFDAPDIPNTFRDASAAAIMASALIEISGYVDPVLTKRYLDVAEIQLRTLSSPEYFAETGTNGNFIIKHGVGSVPGNSEVDVPLTYADYYYIEALLRFQALK